MNGTIDYLTVTTSDWGLGLEWRREFEKYTSYSPLAKGRKIEDTSFYGYDGFEVEGIGFWGTRAKTGAMLTLYGGFADALYPLIKVTPANVTRIDLSVTIELEKPDVHLAARHFNKLQKLEGRKTHRIMQSNSGSTLYLGSVKSDTLGRLYDKGGQQGEELGKRWRYEVVLRKPRAHPAALGIKELMDKQGMTDASRVAIASFVWNWFLNRGVKPVFNVKDASELNTQIEYSETSADRKLAWFRDQIKPSLWWLISEGYREELEETLGVQLVLPGGKGDASDE